MTITIFLLLVTVPAVLLVCRTEQRTKRGCGRGCATCGNREICHPGESAGHPAAKKREAAPPVDGTASLPPGGRKTQPSVLVTAIESSSSDFKSTVPGSRSSTRWRSGPSGRRSRRGSNPCPAAALPDGQARKPCRHAAGTPYLKALSRKPNFSCASSGLMPSAANIRLCTEGSEIRIEPPPNSVPLRTRS